MEGVSKFSHPKNRKVLSSSDILTKTRNKPQNSTHKSKTNSKFNQNSHQNKTSSNGLENYENDLKLKKKEADAAPIGVPMKRCAPPPLSVQLKRKANHDGLKNRRDPRFDDLSGTFDQKAFESNYKFIGKMKRNVKKKLRKQLKSTEDEDQKQEIKSALQIYSNQTRAKQLISMKEKIKKKSREEMITAVSKGQKPYHKKKSEQKLEMMALQYKTLKKEGRLGKYMKKKEKQRENKILFGK